jgi:hypothetical protein
MLGEDGPTYEHESNRTFMFPLDGVFDDGWGTNMALSTTVVTLANDWAVRVILDVIATDPLDAKVAQETNAHAFVGWDFMVSAHYGCLEHVVDRAEHHFFSGSVWRSLASVANKNERMHWALAATLGAIRGPGHTENAAGLSWPLPRFAETKVVLEEQKLYRATRTAWVNDRIQEYLPRAGQDEGYGVIMDEVQLTVYFDTLVDAGLIRVTSVVLEGVGGYSAVKQIVVK